MKRRSFLIGTLGVPMMSLSVNNAHATERAVPADVFSFVHLTDTHIQPELDAAAGCHKCFKQVATESADFVIHGGDHVFDAMEVGRSRAEMLLNLYIDTQRVIGKKVYHTIGNHDCFGIFPTSGVDPQSPGFGKQLYIERFGAPFYSFDHKGIHFVILDSIGITLDRSYEGRIDPEQIDWLKRDLAALPPGKRIIVSTHIPLVTALSCYEPIAWTKTPHNWTNIVNAREILGILGEYRVLAVLQGHGHVAETVTLNGIPFITGGSVCGADWRGGFLGTPEGYMLVTVDGDRVSTRYTTYGFRSVDRHDVEISPGSPR